MPKHPGPGGPPRGGFAKPKNLRRTLGKLMKYLGRYKLALCLVAVLLVVSSACTVGGSYLIKPLINDYILPGDFPGLARMLSIMAAVYIAGAACSFGYARIMVHISQNTMAKIRADLFDKMQSLPLKFFDVHTHGELMSRYTNDIETVSEALYNSFGSLISCSLNFVGTILMMLVLSPPLTLITFAVLAVMLLVVKQIGGRSRRFFAQQQKALGEVNGYIEEMMEGQKVVKVFCHEAESREKFDELNEELFHSAKNANTFANILMPVMANLGNINYVLTLGVGAVFAINGIGGLTLGALASFLQLTRSFNMPITQVSQQFNSIIMALAGAERIFDLLDEPEEVDDGYVTLVHVTEEPDGTLKESKERTGIWAWKHPHKAEGTITYKKLEGDVVLDGVDFGYTDDKIVLHDIKMYANPGEKIAFVGATGAGKTTITNLINRFYDIQDGKVRYDGININKIKKPDLRRSLGIVLQDTHLFTGTIADNIRYGKLNATEEEVTAAAKLANAHYFITKLPDGYDTMLSGDGTSLSQGERQLLAIARAAIADPPVLILDEATSSIDTRTETIVQRGMDQLMKGRTVFVIAHRLSTIKNSDVIMVLDQGRIIERGNHESLLEERGRYYQLYTGAYELS